MLCDRLKGQLSKNIPVPVRAENYRARRDTRAGRSHPVTSWENVLIPGSYSTPIFFADPKPEDGSIHDEWREATAIPVNN